MKKHRESLWKKITNLFLLSSQEDTSLKSVQDNEQSSNAQHAMKPLIIIGLGNPGEKYARTRHNVGFMFVDFLAQQIGADEFKKFKDNNTLVTHGTHNNKKIILAKPQGYMNASGTSVQALTSYYKISPQSDLIIVHDDLDIDFGHFKISKNRGAAGQNGVIDIINKLQTKDFMRFRIGIESRTAKQKQKVSGSNFVLGRFNKQQEAQLHNIYNELETELPTCTN